MSRLMIAAITHFAVIVKGRWDDKCRELEGGTIMTDTATKPPAAENLSAQEQAIEADNLIVHGSATDRVLGLYEAIVGYGRPRVTLDRALVFTESFRETEHEPLVMRSISLSAAFSNSASASRRLSVAFSRSNSDCSFWGNGLRFLGRMYGLGAAGRR